MECPVMRELSGKGWRVLGFFLWMLGAGIVLDSAARQLGGVVLLVGGGLFALGVVQSMRRPTKDPS
jgi:hypothetical protein